MAVHLTPEQKKHLREIAGYKPPSQKGLKRKSVWNKGIEAKQLQGLKRASNGHWRGEYAGYGSQHKWVRRWKGTPTMCEKCGCLNTGKWSIQWANIDHQYRRVLDDYIAMCVKCHHQFDREHNGYKH